MENINNETVRITIDLPKAVADFLETQAKDNDRIRKNHIENILKRHVAKDMPKAEATV